MNTVLYTGYDAPYLELADLTVPLMRNYAKRHGLDFIAFTEPPKGLNMYWTGVARGLELLRDGYERICYLDVDEMITNPDTKPEFVRGGFHCSKDWGNDATEPWHFSACGWTADKDCIPMFEQVLEMEPEWRDKPFQEQGPWREWMRRQVEHLRMVDKKPGETNWNAALNFHPRRTFNAVPDEVCPGEVPEPWEVSDFAAHLTMLEVPERVKLFHRLKRKLC